ncbi:MAG: hypothetical protein FJX22_03070 [Alphaproteobacteria bacterium]|nr:hypothetical protein [Alphaproteobacteria bacterium]
MSQRVNIESETAIDHHHVGFLGRIGDFHFCYVHDMENGNLIEALAIRGKDGKEFGSYGVNQDILSRPDGLESKDPSWLEKVIQNYLFYDHFGSDGNPVISAKVSYGGNAAQSFGTLPLLEAWRDANDGKGNTPNYHPLMISYMNRLAEAEKRLSKGGDPPSATWATDLNLPDRDLRYLIASRGR